MSWFFACIGNVTEEIKNEFNFFNDKILYEYNSASFFLKAGSNKDTCFFSTNQNTQTNTLSLGIGLKNGNENSSLMNSNDWSMIDSLNKTKDVNGHFIHFLWNNDLIEIFTDIWGLRDFYISNCINGRYFLSTRIDWLKKFVNSSMNFSEFGSRWLLCNQISTKSVLTNIHRISNGTSISIVRKVHQLTKNEYNWQPKVESKTTIQEYSSILKTLINITDKKPLTLCLSGGFDSRLILSYLLKSKNKEFNCVSFGEQFEPDIIIAKEIAKELKLNFEVICNSITDIDKFLVNFKEYTLQTIINSSASRFFHLSNYNELLNRNTIIIDGGFGEIWRREFGKKLLLFGKSAIKEKNPFIFFKYLRNNKADFFSSDINNIMYNGAIEQIKEYFENNTYKEEIGVDNFIDVFSIKTRLANFYSPEQTYLDTKLITLMPYIQNILLKNLLNVDIKYRRNGRMLKKILKNNFPELRKFHLAKNDFTYSYKFNAINQIISKYLFKNKNINQLNYEKQKNLILTLTPYILDSINSNYANQCGYFDKNKLLLLSNSLSNRDINPQIINDLDWWLSIYFFITN
ncbi:MAG TPA: asparagine synthase-related protein [Candidatus Kapabacteria bacterium]|nr:asparagine synthase-related protein [Candidatus Kapabacteria bacterium]